MYGIYNGSKRVSRRRHATIRKGEKISLYRYPSKQLYYCIDNSYGLDLHNRGKNPQYNNGEVIGSRGSRYIIIGECGIITTYDSPYYHEEILNIVVESIDTGGRYLVQKRFFKEILERDYAKIVRLQNDIRELELEQKDIGNSIINKKRQLDKEMN